MFEKRRRTKEAERAAEEERRINYAADREREKIEAARAEKAGREADGLHRIGFIGEKLDAFEESQGDRKVERARKREGKRIRKEKNRKYWIILFMVLALAAGGVCGYLIDNHMMQKKYYEKASQLILDEEYGRAAVILEELTIKDSEKLFVYADIRADVKAYDGKTNKMLSRLNKLDPLDSSRIESQYKEFVGEIKPVGTLQRDINRLDVDTLKLADKSKVEELDKKADELEGTYAKMLDKSNLKAAEKKIQLLEEAADKLKNYSSNSKKSQ